MHDACRRSGGSHGRCSECLLTEHKSFTELLESLGCTVDVAPPVDGLVDAVYMHDPMIMTPHGAILLRMAKPVRSPEPAEFRKDLERLGVPILGQLTDPAFADGGDKVWLDAKTLLIGHGYRTNQAGIDQVRALLTPHGVDVFGLTPITHRDAVKMLGSKAYQTLHCQWQRSRTARCRPLLKGLAIDPNKGDKGSS